MKKQSLKKHTTEFYQEQTLSNDKIERLMAMSAISDESKLDTNARPSSRRYQFAPIWAAAAILLLAIPVFFKQFPIFSNNTGIIPQEIALNHNKHLELEYKSSDYQELNQLMTKLDFQLVASNNPTLSHLKPLGARYCSIQGNLAAQIRLEDEDGKQYTLYQTPVTSQLASTTAATQTVGTLQVNLWKEQNLFFGLATPL